MRMHTHKHMHAPAPRSEPARDAREEELAERGIVESRGSPPGSEEEEREASRRERPPMLLLGGLVGFVVGVVVVGGEGFVFCVCLCVSLSLNWVVDTCRCTYLDESSESVEEAERWWW